MDIKISYIYFVNSRTTTDFEGIFTVRIPSFRVNPLKSEGLTESGFSKLLKEFISGAVSTSPVTFLNVSPITGHVTVIALAGFRLASEICTLPSLSIDADAEIAGIFYLPLM
jgi:hypothetical protein